MRIVGAFACVLLSACAGAPAPPDAHEPIDEGAAPRVDCGFGSPSRVGALSDAQVDELSGLAASRVYPGTLWAHNDSGDTPRVFALRPDGSVQAIVSVQVPRARDWEDVAIGPVPGRDGDYLFVGDIGDNDEARASVSVVRFAEPDPTQSASVSADVIELSYGDGAHDCETLLVDPASGDLYLVTKNFLAQPSFLYVARAPHTVGGVTPMERVGTLAPRSPDVAAEAFTAGDIAAARDWIALRTYRRVELFSIAPGQTIAAALLGEPCLAPAPNERQGEAIALDGSGYVTISEGQGAPVWRVARR